MPTLSALRRHSAPLFPSCLWIISSLFMHACLRYDNTLMYSSYYEINQLQTEQNLYMSGF